MPLYMDRHDGENLTPKLVAEGHAADLKLQDKYNCKFITYWYDDESDSVFCLVKAPDMSAVHNVHNEAHGFVHSEIMEVDQAIVKAFLGRVEDPAPTAGEVPIDSPFRAIMFTDLEGSTQTIRHPPCLNGDLSCQPVPEATQPRILTEANCTFARK